MSTVITCTIYPDDLNDTKINEYNSTTSDDFGVEDKIKSYDAISCQYDGFEEESNSIPSSKAIEFHRVHSNISQFDSFCDENIPTIIRQLLSTYSHSSIFNGSPTLHLIKHIVWKMIAPLTEEIIKSLKVTENDQPIIKFSWYRINVSDDENIFDILKGYSFLQAQSNNNNNFDLVMREIGDGKGVVVPGLWEVDVMCGNDIMEIYSDIISVYEKAKHSDALAHSVMTITFPTRSSNNNESTNLSGLSNFIDPPSTAHASFIFISELSPLPSFLSDNNSSSSSSSIRNNSNTILTNPDYYWKFQLTHILNLLQNQSSTVLPYHKSRLCLLLRDALEGVQPSCFHIFIDDFNPICEYEDDYEQQVHILQKLHYFKWMKLIHLLSRHILNINNKQNLKNVLYDRKQHKVQNNNTISGTTNLNQNLYKSSITYTNSNISNMIISSTDMNNTSTANNINSSNNSNNNKTEDSYDTAAVYDQTIFDYSMYYSDSDKTSEYSNEMVEKSVRGKINSSRQSSSKSVLFTNQNDHFIQQSQLPSVPLPLSLLALAAQQQQQLSAELNNSQDDDFLFLLSPSTVNNNSSRLEPALDSYRDTSSTNNKHLDSSSNYITFNKQSNDTQTESDSDNDDIAIDSLNQSFNSIYNQEQLKYQQPYNNTNTTNNNDNRIHQTPAYELIDELPVYDFIENELDTIFNQYSNPNMKTTQYLNNKNISKSITNNATNQHINNATNTVTLCNNVNTNTSTTTSTNIHKNKSLLPGPPDIFVRHDDVTRHALGFQELLSSITNNNSNNNSNNDSSNDNSYNNSNSYDNNNKSSGKENYTTSSLNNINNNKNYDDRNTSDSNSNTIEDSNSYVDDTDLNSHYSSDNDTEQSPSQYANISNNYDNDNILQPKSNSSNSPHSSNHIPTYNTINNYTNTTSPTYNINNNKYTERSKSAHELFREELLSMNKLKHQVLMSQVSSR